MKRTRILTLLAALLLAPCTMVRAELAQGLLNYWDFEGNYNDVAQGLAGSSSTAADNGTAVDGTNVVLTADGPLGTYANFTGGYIEVPDSDDIQAAGESLTISAWFRVGTFSENWQALISHGESTDYRIARRAGSNVMGYAGGVGDIPANDTTGPNVNDGAWHHVVAITEHGVSTRLWVDGGLVATGGVPGLTDNGQGRLLIGGNPGAASPYRPWRGDIDEVAMWNRPLTDLEIGLIYTEGQTGTTISNLLTPGDADGDGLPDFWETGHGLNPNSGAGNDGAAGDPDADGSPNSQELAKNTDPQDPDSDDDFSNDGAEATRGTNPLDPDSDDDGILDGYETKTGVFVSATDTGTDPLLLDTDGDGADDRVELLYSTNPTLAASVPPLANTLPLTDDFGDAVFDTVKWKKNLAIAPATGAVVSETGGHLTLGSRGYLVTREEFDPEALGGLSISGEWTFITMSGGDFIQVLTRSDGLSDPANCCGETQSGVEFYASGIDGAMSIRARNGDHTVSNVITGGAVTLTEGKTYVFTATDNGLGDLTFVVAEKGNPLNAASVTATLDFSASTGNYVVFHNRESGRVSQIETVTIKKLPDADHDGMDDDWEVANGLNPAVDDSAGDPDNDNSPNLAEFQRLTDPQDSDTDNDGALDGSETDTGFFASLTDRGTKPLDPDTDNDGLLDGVETNTGTFVSATDTGTDPHLADTDSDGMLDGTEISRGRDPNSAADGSTGLALGLVAYWNFDGTLDDIAHTLPTDSTVADTGVFTGPETDVGYGVDAKFGPSALEQNGGDGWVTVNASADTLHGTTNTVSVSVWVKATALDVGWQGIVSHGEGTQYRIARNGTNSNFAYAGGIDDITGGNPGDDGEWHHIVAISEASVSTSLYVDGTLAATGGVPDINDLGNGSTIPNLFIGANPQGGNREWNGFIDDVAIWGRAISEEEVQSIWADGAGKSIASLIGGGGGGAFAITAWSYNAGTGAFTLTWESSPGENFGVFYSTDMTNWDADVADSVPAAVGPTTSLTFPNPQPGAAKLFFRVEKN